MTNLFIAIAVITNDKGQYLLIKRARDPYSNHWSFIAGIGASKKGLSPDQAVIGEVKHDINASFIGQLAFTYTIPNPDQTDTAHVFVGTVDQEEIVLNTKAGSEYKWFTAQELQQQDNLGFETKWIIENLQRNR